MIDHISFIIAILFLKYEFTIYDMAMEAFHRLFLTCLEPHHQWPSIVAAAFISM